MLRTPDIGRMQYAPTFVVPRLLEESLTGISQTESGVGSVRRAAPGRHCNPSRIQNREIQNPKPAVCLRLDFPVLFGF